MKSVEFLIYTRHQAKKLVISTPKKVNMVLYHLYQQNFYPKLHIIKMFKKFPFQNIYCSMVQVKSYSIITDEIGKFCRKLENFVGLICFQYRRKTLKIWIFKLHKSEICRKTNSFGTFWLFFPISMVI